MGDDDEEVKKRATLLLVRNAECEWNEKNLFCGWYDSPLSENGKSQAVAAAAMIKKKKFQVDTAHTSLLSRANDTLKIILEELKCPDVPIQVTWRLNPKHYGALTSWCKSELAGKYGEEQVLLWRRSYLVAPPPIEVDHEYFYEFLDDYRYKAPEQLVENFPFCENLEQVLQRLLPYWLETIIPQLQEGNTVLIAGHGNSLRALMKHIDGMTEEALLDLTVPHAIPFFYELNMDNWRPAKPMRYMTDESTTQKGIDKVVQQGKAQ